VLGIRGESKGSKIGIMEESETKSSDISSKRRGYDRAATGLMEDINISLP
jgi:hypothetical protein